jgi:group II intron reverse transcriptase/maturase
MVKPRQLQLAFAESPPCLRADTHRQEGIGQKGTTGVPDVRSWLRHIAGDKALAGATAEATDTGQLLERVASASNLARALLNVARNKGAAGVDGQSVEAVVAHGRQLLPKLHAALLDGTYQPGDIRRAWIPKPGGGQRGLGIPNVIDRWVQEAMRLVLEPIFEPHFHHSSHGFRPERGAQTAIAEASRYVGEGCRVTVDLDLAKFFDTVNWQRLLARLAQRVKDKRVLELIHRMLKAKVVMPDGTKIRVVEGTPQGGPLSPLLSNIVLDELDWELQRRGLRFVRYADDCNLYVKSERAGQRVMESIRRFIERRLRLKLNEEKSSVDYPDKVHFLGFRLCRDPEGRARVYLSARSHERLAQRVRELTPRNWGQSLAACIERVNSYLTGWEAYFGLCCESEARAWQFTEAHIRRRLRAIVVHQRKRSRFLYRHLLRRGVAKATARNTAFSRKKDWAKSHMNGLHRAYPNAWFAERLVSLWGLWRHRHPIPPSQPVPCGQSLLALA